MKFLPKHVFVLLSAAFIVGCSDSQQETQAQPELSALAEAEYPKAEAPTTEPVFRWDFSDTQKAFLYDYQQEVEMLTQTGTTHTDETEIQEQYMKAKGRLQIVPRRNRTADLLLQNVRAEMRMGGASAPTETQVMPAVEISGLREDGSGGSGDAAHETFLRMLFPLPTKSLAVGESVRIPAEMPYQVGDESFQVRGFSEITLVGYVYIEDRLCAKLSIVSDISQLELPARIQGQHGLSARGNSVFYFDVEERAFVEGYNDLFVQLLTEDAVRQMAMESRNKISVKRR